MDRLRIRVGVRKVGNHRYLAQSYISGQTTPFVDCYVRWPPTIVERCSQATSVAIDETFSTHRHEGYEKPGRREKNYERRSRGSSAERIYAFHASDDGAIICAGTRGAFGFILYERKFRNYSTADVQTFLRALARSPVVTWERTWLLFNVDDEFLTADDEFLTARYPPVILHLLRRWLISHRVRRKLGCKLDDFGFQAWPV